MITRNNQSQIDAVWNALHSGAMPESMETMEQVVDLLFLRHLDTVHDKEEEQARRLAAPFGRRIFPPGNDPLDRPYDDLRWSRFKNFTSAEMFEVVGKHAFPFLRTLNGDVVPYAIHFKDARFALPTPAVLAELVTLLDKLVMDEEEFDYQVYFNLLCGVEIAGPSGQFLTQPHISRLMVELLAPRAEDQICDPACGTCGLLVATGDYLHQKKPAHAYDFSTMLHGRDINDTMLRVGCMNLLINDIDGADIRHMNSLGREQTEEDGKYTVVLASPPFSGTMDLKSVSRALQASIDTRRTELLFMARVLQLLKTGGRAAVIVPDELLSSSAAPHKEMRRRLVDEQKLDGVVMLPSRLFHPFYSEAAAILLFTKTNAGGTDQVWFYDLLADGWSLDVRRQHLLPCSKLGACSSLSAHEHAKNNLPDVITRWRAKNGAEKSRTRADQSFCVPHADIVAKAYDLSLKSYIDVPPVRSPVREATEILSSLARLEDQIIRGIKGLKVIFK